MSEFDPFPTGRGLSAEALSARFATEVVRPLVNAGYAFRLRRPRDWVSDDIDGMDRGVDAERLTPLAAWHVDKDGPPVVFHVQAILLPRAISAAHFSLEQGLRQGMRVEASREVSPVLAETLFLREVQGQPFGVRTATALFEGRAFLASGVAHASELDAFNEDFGVAASSLTVLERPASPWVERRTRRAHGGVEFDLPSSFRAAPVPGPDGHEVLDLVQLDAEGTCTAVIRVDFDREAGERSVEQELAYVAAHLLHRGATLAESTEELAVAADDGPLSVQKSLLVRATQGELPQEVWITLARVRGAALRIWMLGPVREERFGDWAANQRAYRILLESLRAL